MLLVHRHGVTFPIHRDGQRNICKFVSTAAFYGLKIPFHTGLVYNNAPHSPLFLVRYSTVFCIIVVTHEWAVHYPSTHLYSTV
jgi:hypothetical protein